MLSTIKSYISNQEDISFDEYYNRYVMEVQDKNLNKEISYMLSANSLNVLNMSILIKDTVEGLNKLW